jgi:hypothetical protein
LEVQAPEVDALLDFNRGELIMDGYDLSEADLEELAELRVGTFAIRARPSDAAEQSAQPSEHGQPLEPAALQSVPPPASRVTGVAVGDHLVNVETEYEGGESEQIATVVSVDGTERKRTTSIPPPLADRDTLEHYMAEQHAAVEAGVLGKVEALLVHKHKRPAPTDSELDRFVWLVRHACAKGDHAGALEILSGALAMFPDDASLNGYLQWSRRKRDEG